VACGASNSRDARPHSGRSCTAPAKEDKQPYVDNDTDDDGDDAAKCSALITFRLTHVCVRTQVVHTKRACSRPPERRIAGLLLPEAPPVSASAFEQRWQR
jgi:hypothetical protein